MLQMGSLGGMCFLVGTCFCHFIFFFGVGLLGIFLFLFLWGSSGCLYYYISIVSVL